ncbi:hypothetical protein O181_005587 [Austropuccinia psidii MF-1]|uniref:Uncharacterized protein n=1 Tax=Austropuccinia psidii MF-1 TaxID=1389203 RepID=A0A9Q3BJ16_9BASI|nr:hypothetical protein [Austropuccinia psidii MF-1]
MKSLFEKDIEKRSFNKCPRDKIAPAILLQYNTLGNSSIPVELCSTMVPIALTLKDSDDETDNVILVAFNEVNNKKFPTTKWVAPESSNASFPSKVGTTPIPATLTRRCCTFIFSSFTFAFTGQLGDQCLTSPQ